MPSWSPFWDSWAYLGEPGEQGSHSSMPVLLTEGRMACSPQIERWAVVGILEVLHSARQQTVILKSLAWEVGRVVGWGSRGLGKAWPMCLCAVPSELKGEGRNPAPLLHGPLCPEGEMLELTEQRRLGSGRGGSSSHSCLCLTASHRSAVQPEPGWSSASSRL